MRVEIILATRHLLINSSRSRFSLQSTFGLYRMKINPMMQRRWGLDKLRNILTQCRSQSTQYKLHLGIYEVFQLKLNPSWYVKSYSYDTYVWWVVYFANRRNRDMKILVLQCKSNKNMIVASECNICNVVSMKIKLIAVKAVAGKK